MTSSRSFTFTEDWVVVILGIATIFLALSGIVAPVPSFSWSNSAELVATVFDPTNLMKLFEQFIFVFVTAILGAFLLGKSVKHLFVVFPVVFILTVFALVLAGNATVKEYNLEAVIFSLIIGLVISNCFKLPNWFKEALSTEL